MEEEMICRKCGKENSDKHVICQNCGEEFDVRFSYFFLNNAQLLILFFIPIVLVFALVGASYNSGNILAYLYRVLTLLLVGLLPIGTGFILLGFTKLKPIASLNNFLERGPNLFLTFVFIVLLGFTGIFSSGSVKKMARSLPSRIADLEQGQSPKDAQIARCTESISRFSQQKIEPDSSFLSACGMFDFNELLSRAGIESYEVTYTYTQNNIDFNFDYPLGSKVELQQIGNLKIKNEKEEEVAFRIYRKELFGEDKLMKNAQLVREYNVKDFKAKEFINKLNDNEKINTLIQLDDATLLVSSLKGVNEDMYKKIISSIRS